MREIVEYKKTREFHQASFSFHQFYYKVKAMKLLVVILAIVGLCYAAEDEIITGDAVVRPLSIIPFSLERGSRIVNGFAASANQFPHQALTFTTTFQGVYQCGGSLISSLWILSAAHCIVNSVNIQVFLGSTNRNSMPVRRNGCQALHLTSYNPQTLKDDIALIKMDQAVAFGANVKAIQLPARSQANALLLGDILTVSGFGLTTANQVSTNLLYTRVVGISNAECQSVYRSNPIASTVLCTRGYPNTNTGHCSGDSGGPLIQGSTLVGIVSFGSAQSCTNGLPQGFTRVGSYLDFISKYTGIAIRN